MLGFLVAFPIDYRWFKWPLSRFLIVGATLGSICLVIGLDQLLRGLKPKFQRICWGVVLVAALTGPLSGLLLEGYENTRNLNVLFKNLTYLALNSDYTQ